MPVPPEKRNPFFVYIVESPSAQDLYLRRSEGDLIRQAIALDEIPSASRCAISRDAFEAALVYGLSEALDAWKGRAPILHISAHGGEEGIALSSGEVLLWRDLKDLLAPINKALNDGLLVCMSSCHGFAGIRMAMHPDDPHLPFFALVGNSQKPTWADTAIAFATFYHLIEKGYSFREAVEAMKKASGSEHFDVMCAADARQSHVEYIRDFDTTATATALAAGANIAASKNLRKLSAGNSAPASVCAPNAEAQR